MQCLCTTIDDSNPPSYQNHSGPYPSFSAKQSQSLWCSLILSLNIRVSGNIIKYDFSTIWNYCWEQSIAKCHIWGYSCKILDSTCYLIQQNCVLSPLAQQRKEASAAYLCLQFQILLEMSIITEKQEFTAGEIKVKFYFSIGENWNDTWKWLESPRCH